MLLLCLLLTLIGGCGGTGRVGPTSFHQNAIEDYFHILQTPPETVRGREWQRILSSISLGGAQPPTSRPQLAKPGHGDFWVLTASRDLLCIARTSGAACARLKVAAKQGVFLGTFQPPTKQRPAMHEFLVEGVVPDGVQHVSVAVGTNRTRVVPVRGNVFSVSAEQPVHVKRLLRH